MSRGVWTWNLLGLLLLVGLCWRLPLGAVVDAVRHMGWRVLGVFAFGLVWVVCDVSAMAIQAGFRVGWWTLLRVELIAEAMARLVPAGGLGGEPYRTRVMATTMGYDDATRSVFAYRLVHAVSGIAFAACMLLLARTLHPLPPVWSRAFLLLGLGFGLGAVVLAGVALSDLPARLAHWLLARLGLAGVAARARQVGHARAFWWGVVCKQTAFVLQLAELWVIFRLLGLDPTLTHLVVVAAAIAATGTVMFMVPGGVGVSEMGITVAFGWLGLPTWMGLTLGLVRRARLVIWTLLGLAIFALDSVGMVPSGAAAGQDPVLGQGPSPTNPSPSNPYTDKAQT